jgi:uncharacterized LabA/DUF88 family protein
MLGIDLQDIVMPQDLAPLAVTPVRAARVALMVDGDNLTHDLAGRVLMAAGRHGQTLIRRVYGNMTNLKGWRSAPGFALIHAGCGKNAADMLLTVQAMDLMLRGAADVLVLASSDGDFSHLATHLREAGYPVVGLGEDKAPESFRKSCSRFEELSLPQSVPKPAPPPPAKPAKIGAEHWVTSLIVQRPGGMAVPDLNEHMHKAHGFKIKDQPEKTWRAWLKARHDLFVYDPNGGTPQVRLVNKP